MSPKRKVADRLLDMGFKIDHRDISFTQGGRWVVLDDIVEKWNVTCESPEGKQVEIYSAYTLTECARQGFTLEPNTRDSDLYGDLLVVIKPAGARRGQHFIRKKDGKEYRVTQTGPGHVRLLWDAFGPSRRSITGTWWTEEEVAEQFTPKQS